MLRTSASCWCRSASQRSLGDPIRIRRCIHCAHIGAEHASGNPRRCSGSERRAALHLREIWIFICRLPRRERKYGTRQQRGWEAPPRSKSVVIPLIPLHFSAHATANMWRVRDKTFLIPQCRILTPVPPPSMHTFLVGRTERTGPRQTPPKAKMQTWATNISVQGLAIQGSGMLSSSGETLA